MSRSARETLRRCFVLGIVSGAAVRIERTRVFGTSLHDLLSATGEAIGGREPAKWTCGADRLHWDQRQHIVQVTPSFNLAIHLRIAAATWY